MKIPLSSVNLSDLEKSYAAEAVGSGWISGAGGYLTRFEEALGRRTGREFVIAVPNGTLALELTLRALGVGPGDEVIVPALTFVTPAAVVRSVGALPVFADVSPQSWTIDPQAAGELISPNTRAVIAVDVLGHPADYEVLKQLGPPVIEDAAEAHGALYKGREVGKFGLASCFSFHANKTIATGEGGCVATDDPELAARMRLIANHGMTSERPYWHSVVGTNFRMTNVTAAIGLGQVQRWDELVRLRNQVAATYDQRIDFSNLGRRPVADWATEACWLYTLTAPDRESLLAHLRSQGIDARAIWTALPDLPPYRGCPTRGHAVAAEIANHAFWLPTWAGMPEDLIRLVADGVNSWTGQLRRSRAE